MASTKKFFTLSLLARVNTGNKRTDSKRESFDKPAGQLYVQAFHVLRMKDCKEGARQNI